MFFKKDPEKKQETFAERWRVDLKWFYGILLVVFTTVGLVFVTLYQYTDRDTSVSLMSHVFAAMASPAGLDDETDVAGLRAILEKAGGEEVKPFPGMNIRVEQSDLEGLTPREARLFLFRQISEPLWEKGEDGMADVADGKEALAEFKKSGGAGMFAALTQKNNKMFSFWATIFLVMAGAFLVGVIRFSRGFGRLVTPGVCLLLAGLPGTMLALRIEELVKKAAEGPTSAGTSDAVGYYVYAAAQSLLGEIGNISVTYVMVAFVGAAFLVIAFALNGLLFIGAEGKALFVWLRDRKGRAKS